MRSEFIILVNRVNKEIKSFEYFIYIRVLSAENAHDGFKHKKVNPNQSSKKPVSVRKIL